MSAATIRFAVGAIAVLSFAIVWLAALVILALSTTAWVIGYAGAEGLYPTTGFALVGAVVATWIVLGAKLVWPVVHRGHATFRESSPSSRPAGGFEISVALALVGLMIWAAWVQIRPPTSMELVVESAEQMHDPNFNQPFVQP